jgi:hypothetical protein
MLNLDFIDLLFIAAALLFNLLVSGVYLAQAHEQALWLRRFGTGVVALALPFAAVWVAYWLHGSPPWVLAFLGILLLYLAVEFLLDFVLKVDFRRRPILHVPYILLFYAAAGGLIGIAFTIHSAWGYVVSITFWLLLGCLVYTYLAGRKKKATR